MHPPREARYGVGSDATTADWLKGQKQIIGWQELPQGFDGAQGIRGGGFATCVRRCPFEVDEWHIQSAGNER
ncbi:hypothetical protein [Streptomyces gobiensis]|uniref:hypothetical protein n=1 Tax=Streptomyces gobiensis TaxID=2875706 RepID=UPI001E34AD41|nr:hypothetical protein [Streptomyces gobiensis]UGY95320.1 hypothetical protein test1122_04230 [Streptomyces gobiensis]